MKRRFFSTGEVAVRTGAMEWAVRRLMRANLIPHVLVGRMRLLDESDLPAAVAALRAAGHLPNGRDMAAQELQGAAV